MQKPTTRLARVIRARAKHFFGLPIKVKQKGDGLILSITDKRSGRTESEFLMVDEDELNSVLHNEDDLEYYVDRVINRFMYPVTAL